MAMERINLNYDRQAGRFGYVYLAVIDSANGVEGPSVELKNDHACRLNVGCGVKELMVKCSRDWYVIRTVRHLGEAFDYSLTIGKIVDEKTGRRQYLGTIFYKGPMTVDREFVEHFQEEAGLYHRLSLMRRGMSSCNIRNAVI